MAARWIVLDLAQQVLELGIGLAVDRHAAEVADIAVIVAAGIEREDVALLPALLGRRAVEAGARGDQAIVEGEAAAGLLAPQRLGQLALGRSRPMLGDHRQHGIDHRFGSDAQLARARLGLFTARSRSSTNTRVHDLAVGECLAQRAAGIDRQERKLGADPLRLASAAPDMVERLLP